MIDQDPTSAPRHGLTQGSGDRQKLNLRCRTKTYTNNPEFTTAQQGPVGPPKLTFHYLFQLLLPSRNKNKAFVPGATEHCLKISTDSFYPYFSHY